MIMDCQFIFIYGKFMTSQTVSLSCADIICVTSELSEDRFSVCKWSETNDKCCLNRPFNNILLNALHLVFYLYLLPELFSPKPDLVLVSATNRLSIEESPPRSQPVLLESSTEHLQVRVELEPTVPELRLVPHVQHAVIVTGCNATHLIHTTRVISSHHLVK